MESYLNLRLTAKQLVLQSKRSEKQAKKRKNEVEEGH